DDIQAPRIGGRDLARGEHEHRAHALAAAEGRVAHGVVQPGGSDARCRKELGEHRLHAVRDLARPGFEIGFVHFGSGVKSLSVSPSRMATRAWASASFDSQNLMSSAPRW